MSAFRWLHLLQERHAGIPVWRRFVWLGAVAVIAVVAGFGLFSAREAGRLLKQGGYAAIAGIFVWWVWAILRDAGPGWLRSARAWRAWPRREVMQAGGLISALCLVAAMTTSREHKVLFDEAIIQTTAWNMHMEREVGGLMRAYEVDGLLRSLSTYLDKRPFFYAFLVSLIHDFTGYREANAMALNTALMPVVLVLVYWLGRRLGGHGSGLVAIASLGAFSLLAINSSGAGLEMLNLTLIVALMVVAARYLDRPDESRLAVLILTTVLLAHTRYESAIYVGCTALVALEGWRRAGRAILPVAAIFAPLLLVPYALHNTYLSGTPELWELRDGATSRFSFEFLERNLSFAWEYFLNFKGLIANSPWLTFAGFGASVYLAIWAWRKKPGWSDWTPVAVSVGAVALGIVGNLALLMAYYWGDLSDPVVSRLSLPFHAILALLVAAAVSRLRPDWRGPAASWCVALALVAYVAWGLPVNQRLSHLNTTETAHRWEQDVVAGRGPGTRLVITDKSSLSWFTRGIMSISPQRVRRKPEGLLFHLRHHTFDEILVTETLHPAGPEGGFITSAEHALPRGYVLEQIAERRIGGRLQRISVLREIKADELKPAPESPDEELIEIPPNPA